jgi:hypothetical protein
MGKMTNVYILIRNVKNRHHLEDLGIDGWVILEWLLEKWGGKV